MEPNTICDVCKIPIYRKPSQLKRNKGKFCSIKCRNVVYSEILKKTQFKKGQIPWNKGKKGFYRHTEEWKKLNSLRQKGRISPMKGKCHTTETKIKMSESHKGEKSYAWKGENVGYRALHRWVHSRLGSPQICKFCGKEKTTLKSIHWANKSHKYLRNLNDWISLCVSCHKKYDGYVGEI